MEVRDAAGEKIGVVDDSYTDTGGAYVRYLAIPYTKDQLRDAPTHERDEDFTQAHEEAT